jgi:hypothetical protein
MYNILWLEGKANHWISRINLYHSFVNLKAKQRKNNPGIKRIDCGPFD